MKWANSDEITLVGWCGISIFSLLILYATVGLYFSPKILLPRLFFVSSILASTLDLPRYIFMIIDHEYASTLGYSCHILSNYFFFLSLTLVCVVWAHLLQFGSYTSFIYRGRGVILTNVILAIISIISFAYCLDSSSLSQFLGSTVYYVYIAVEVVENLFYSVVVAFFGIKLVLRFQNYASSNKKNIIQTNAFRKALKKVAVTLCLNAICSTIRILLKLFYVFHSAIGPISSPYFRKYGLVWFIWSDFIPKGIATIAFLNLMNSRANQRQGSSDVKPSWASNVNELELERSNYDVNPDNRASDVVENPVNGFDIAHEMVYPDEYPDDTVSVSFDENDRQTQSSSSFWESPTAAQDALNMMTKRPD